MDGDSCLLIAATETGPYVEWKEGDFLLSSLSGADKRLFEEIFGMGKGLVLDFTSPSFERYFNDYGIEIFGTKYEIHGTSKANRLRAFWDMELDELVGRVLLGLLESSVFLDRDAPEFRKSHEIAAKLAGMSLGESSANDPQHGDQVICKLSEERQLERLWGPGQIRVFISHTNQHKNDAMSIKSALKIFGIASFVAHIDIEPSEEWQSVIVRALSSMNLLVALLTESFNVSSWTDQEVGFALARNVPVLPVDRGLVPYGFISKYQALRWNRSDAFPVAKEILEMALKNDGLETYAKTAFIEAVGRAESWAEANRLSRILPNIESLSAQQADWFMKLYNSNSQVYEAWNFQDRISNELSRMTGNTYEVDSRLRLRQV